jgi:hypothetical protein
MESGGCGKYPLGFFLFPEWEWPPDSSSFELGVDRGYFSAVKEKPLPFVPAHLDVWCRRLGILQYYGYIKDPDRLLPKLN